MNGRRKVQAQRKFAQGAYIPPSNAGNAAPARAERSDSNTSRDERNIIYNSVSARNLLDVVSFQSMHTHSDPIVLIERLAPTKEMEPKKPEPERTPPAKPPVTSPPVVTPTRPKLKLATRNSTMCLRSRSGVPGRSMALSAKRKESLRKAPKRLLKSGRKRILEKTYPTSDTDDNIPLKFFKKVEPTPAAAGTAENEELRVTRSSALPNVKPVNKVKSTKLKEVSKLPSKIDNKAFKLPAVPIRHRRRGHILSKKIAVAAPSAKKPPPAPRQDRTQFYGNHGIERWLNGHSKKPTVANGESTACPAESLRTVRDVFSAKPGELARRCHDCDYCARVNMVEKISNLVQSSCADSESDVYEFSERDATPRPPPLYVRRERQRPPSPSASVDTDEQIMYLDLQKDSPHIIQIASVKLPGSKKRIMKARIIPKSEALTTDDFSLVEHENLLEQLMQTLQVNTPAEENQEGNHSSSNVNTINKNFRPKPGRVEDPKIPEQKTPKPAVLKPPPMPVPKPSTSKIPEAENLFETKHGNLLEAPTFYPTEAEFNDPIAFFEKIAPTASKYGLCKVVAPESFKPVCILNDDIKFNVSNHYIARLYSRWGPIAREMCAMKAYLASQKVSFSRVPLLDSLEVNLHKLYTVVQKHGGLKQVMDKKRWGRVAEDMRFANGANTERTLDSYYVKYILPYDTATNQERTNVMSSVERAWNTKYRKLLNWAQNPLHHQKKLLGESDSSEEETMDEDSQTNKALYEAEDCVVQGRAMNLSCFKKVASHARSMYLGAATSAAEAEAEYWRVVLFGTEHVCVNAASVDTSAGGYGFSRNKADPASRHPWNLKMLSSNPGNVLRSLGAVVGVTVPTLHLGMVFSTSCWHRDPHGLPWIEYMHDGPPKIWYGIPDEQSANFRKAVEALCPTSCQNKSIWLSSDITMIPPQLLCEHRVSLARAEQRPGEFIIVFPKAYSCSISTGFTVSESVYFATDVWLNTVHQVFQELRSSCEPTTFSLEQLLVALAGDARTGAGALRRVRTALAAIVADELRHRRWLRDMRVTTVCNVAKKRSGAAWNVREQAECQICRSTLYLSKVTGIIGKRQDVCLMHALRLLQSPKYRDVNTASVEMVLFYSQSKLKEIMTNLNNKIFPNGDDEKGKKTLIKTKVKKE